MRTNKGRWADFSSHVYRLILATGAAALLTLSACSGGASNGASSTQPTGNAGAAMITLTDAPGDFLSYVVNVVSLQLTRSDGTVVETVSTATQVDFAQLVNLSEVISAAQVPSGKYVAASMTIDYGEGTAADPNAMIVVDNGAGGLTVPAGNIINGSTMAPLVAPNNQITMTLQLPANTPLVITPGTVANLALDFDLAASNAVTPAMPSSTTAASSVMVTVNPVLSASLTPDTTKQIRVRGPLVSVTNTMSNTSYTVSVRPFFNAGGSQGQVVVNTTATTSFAINGTAYTGNAGLTALAALATGTLTAAYGAFDVSTQTFTASTVYAGSSIPGAGQDSVEGTVIARSADNVLTVSRGIVFQPASLGQFGQLSFSRQLAVTVAATTTVTEDGQAGPFTAQDISVGQHLQVFGTLGQDTSGNPTLDATNGSARLMVTPLWGDFSSTTGGVVTVALKTLDGLWPAFFDFTGTGTSSANDAVASAYTVGVPAALQIPAASAGTAIRFYGFVTPFGAAPPDFGALSLVNYTDTNAEFVAFWPRPGLTAPFVAPLSATNVVISQSTLQSAAFEVVQIGPERFDPSTVSAGITLVPNAAASSMQFAIAHWKSFTFDSYSSFSDLIAAVSTDLNGTTALVGIASTGPYDTGTGVLSVNKLIVALND
jgi:Domain of unknown function (DUF4382)